MKRTQTILTILIGWALGNHLHAQGQGNPYEGLNVPPVEILSLSKGKYLEVFDNDTLISIGTVQYNTLTGEVIELLDADSALQHIPPIGVPSRWLSIDPLAAKYPQWSPYAGFADNPVLYVDPDGADIMDGKHKVLVTYSEGQPVFILKTFGFRNFYKKKAWLSIICALKNSKTKT